ncbi:MAG: GNAT family N-acetyltransferase [Actinomycetota bacterium]|nr:GNAT family N-acetyltransferase [Actinomycetota bacterium]
MSILRPIEPDDVQGVLDLNERYVDLLAPMDRDRLTEILGIADHASVITYDGHFAGFVITLESGVDYDSSNYQWYGKQYETFYYLDRVVLHEDFRRLGLGSKVYDELESRAAQRGAPRLALEVNVDPPNLASLAFHRRRGYLDVGEKEFDDHRVALMVKEF